MSKLQVAKDVVRGSAIPDALRKYGEDEVGSYAVDEARCLYYANGMSRFLTGEVTPDVLADCLHYVIDLDTKRIGGEGEVSLGVSKYYGLPHLPDSMDWPEEQYFLAQLNLAELHPHDIVGVFPSSGMLYYFFNSGADCSVIHYDGPMDALDVRKYPDESTLPGAEYYLEDFLKGSARISFKPAYIFYLGGDAYSYKHLKSLIPGELQEELQATLGCSMTTSDSGFKIFGRPHYWQGEDEAWGDEEREPEVLILEDEFGEGNIHFWLSAAAANKGDFSEVWLGYSGT